MELFKKVYIKDELDLPKEYSRLISHYKDEENVFYRIYEPPYDVGEISYIIADIDWYLQPTEIKFPSEKILNKKSIEYAIVEVDNDEGGTDKFVSPIAEYYIDGFNDAINWIRENNIKNERWHNDL